MIAYLELCFVLHVEKTRIKCIFSSVPHVRSHSILEHDHVLARCLSELANTSQIHNGWCNAQVLKLMYVISLGI